MIVLERRRLASIHSSMPIILITTLFVFVSGEIWWRLGHTGSLLSAIAVALLVTTLCWLAAYAYGALLRASARRRKRVRRGFTPAYLANMQTALMGVALLAVALVKTLL